MDKCAHQFEGIRPSAFIDVYYTECVKCGFLEEYEKDYS